MTSDPIVILRDDFGKIMSMTTVAEIDLVRTESLTMLAYDEDRQYVARAKLRNGDWWAISKPSTDRDDADSIVAAVEQARASLSDPPIAVPRRDLRRLHRALNRLPYGDMIADTKLDDPERGDFVSDVVAWLEGLALVLDRRAKYAQKDHDELIELRRFRDALSAARTFSRRSMS